MKPVLRKQLLRDDKELFAQGACHIFADELYKRLAPHGFTLRRLADTNRSTVEFEALHVYVGKGSTMVDVDRIRNETDFIQEMEEFRNNKPVPAFKVFQCSHEELFTPVGRESDADEGIGNRWNHIIEEDFTAACRKRARNIIAASPAKYNPNLTN
ncbi:MAG TPA: hypothetical protein VG103_02925 [Chthoniobacterales bacterium]|jgi:hypothetical protein|nr:hypothetical protein [Chthoniobacterales bacterium]